MKYILTSISLFLCLVLATITHAQDEPLANAVLWKIEGNDLAAASYLMGTIHIMCEDDFEIKDKIKKALEASEDLVLEVNFSDPKVIADMQQAMMSDKKLTDILTEEQVGKVDSILKKSMNTGIEAVNQFSLTALYSLILIQSIDCPIKKMWEMELIEIAKTAEKDIFGLESLDGQIDFFAKAYPIDEMIKQLDLMDEYAVIFDTMIDLYKDESISKLGDVVSDPRFMDENAAYWMLEYRNKNWLKKMPIMMEKGSQFFAVGSAHLVGEFGLIPALKKMGYTLTPILD